MSERRLATELAKPPPPPPPAALPAAEPAADDGETLVQSLGILTATSWVSPLQPGGEYRPERLVRNHVTVMEANSSIVQLCHVKKKCWKARNEYNTFS